MSNGAQIADGGTPPHPIGERILASARRCFERSGVRKTTIEDIAAEAGVARQTVYNHFGSKQDIVERITFQEAVKVQEDMRRRMGHWSRFADKITEAVTASLLVAHENPYLTRMIHDMATPPRVAASGPIYEWRRERWRAALDAGRASGELAADLDIDDVVFWLSLCQLMMQMKMDQVAMSEAEVREAVRRLVVEPLLSAQGAFAAHDELAKLREQAAAFTELAAEQALEIKALSAAK